MSVELKQDISIHSKQKPLLILPTGSLQIQDKVIIQGRAWLVQEQDFITTPGISYYSLTSTTASKTTEEQDSYIESYSEDYSIDQNTFTPNTNITVPTESGYFRSDIAQIKIVSRNSSQVVFQIPFGVDQVTISTKKEGVVVQTTYRVQ